MEQLVEVKDVTKTFQKGSHSFQAVKKLSFHINKGEILGVVGESGCGKSTMAKLITRIQTADSGQIILDGEEITSINGVQLKKVYQKIQMIFQNPAESFDPRQKIGSSIMEPMINHGMKAAKARVKTAELLSQCGLPKEYALRYPHELSGGECQRAAIARALGVEPKLIICDEATSALDVTVQKQMVELLKRLQKEKKMAYLFICHDLALVQEFCDRVLVMYKGELIEEGTPDEIISHPKNTYTKALVDAVYEI